MEKLVFRTSELAYLGGVDLKRVNHWLDQENIYLDGIAQRPGETKHRRFSELDCIRVALIARLLDHVSMLSAKEASGLAEQVIDPYNFRSGNAGRLPADKKTEIIFNTLAVMKAFFWFDPEQEKWVFTAFMDRSDGSREFFGREAKMLADRSVDTYIVIETDKLYKGYLERLEEILKAKE